MGSAGDAESERIATHTNFGTLAVRLELRSDLVSLSNARMVAKLEQLATTDGLTGLLNKRAMQDNATQKVAAAFRFGRKLSVLITDIDFFKKVNDTYGHDVGDVVIKGLGEILKRQKRGTDMVARFGGDEFAVLQDDIEDSIDIETLAAKIGEVISVLYAIDGNQVHTTASIGIVPYGSDVAGADVMMMKAAGSSRPRFGWFHRISASSPTTDPDLSSTCG